MPEPSCQSVPSTSTATQAESSAQWPQVSRISVFVLCPARPAPAGCAILSYYWTHAPGLASHRLVPRQTPNPPAQPCHGAGATLRNASASSHRQQPTLPAVQKTLRRLRPPSSRNHAQTLAAITPGDAAFAQVVGGQLHLHPISRHHTHKVQAYFA